MFPKEIIDIRVPFWLHSGTFSSNFNLRKAVSEKLREICVIRD